MDIGRGLATHQAGGNEGSKRRGSPSPKRSKGNHYPYHVVVDAKDIILAKVTQDSDRELSKVVRFTLAKWISDMNKE
jgi:hypothetical protein